MSTENKPKYLLRSFFALDDLAFNGCEKDVTLKVELARLRSMGARSTGDELLFTAIVAVRGHDFGEGNGELEHTHESP